MSHFLEISQLSAEQINTLLQRALAFNQGRQYPAYPEHTVATLF